MTGGLGHRRIRAAGALVAAFLLSAATAGAQDTDARATEPAFSLSTSQIFTSKDAPHFYLTFRHLTSLDVRVYKVRDPWAFFTGLRQLHEMGTSGTADVPQEPTAIERFAAWKRRQRAALRTFVRGQISREYRAARTVASDRTQAAQRVRLNVSTFAQVPLLNPQQLVTSWRELLPDHRDSELRRIPIEVNEPGVYVVEAVTGLLRAYTIAVVSDVGLVTKTSPGQIVLFAANRFTGEPAAGCEVRVLAARQPIAQGTTTADGTFEATVPETRADEILGLARCAADQIGVTDPGSYGLSEPARQLVGYVYTDKPIYRPGHTVHTKAVLRWRERDALRPFDQPDVELTVSDVNDKVLLRRRLTVDRFGTVDTAVPVPSSAALGRYTIKVTSGELEATGGFEVQEYRRPEFEVITTPAARFVVQGRDAVVIVQARYYFGQPVANAQLRWVVNEQFYSSPLRWNDEADDEGGGYFYGGDQTQEGTVRLDANGRAELRIPLAARTGADTNDYSARIEAQVTDASGRQVSGSTIVHATRGTFLLSARTSASVLAAGSRVPATVDALDYLGAPQPDVPVTITLNRYEYRSGAYNDPSITQVATAQAVTDAKGHAETDLVLPPGIAGSFRVTATATSAGRSIVDHAFLWVPGAQEAEQFGDHRYLELIADQRTYKPGDTARLVVRGEPVTGPIFLTKEGQHVSWYRVVRQNGGAAIEVPIEAGDEGDVYVSLTYLRDGRLFRADRRLGVPAAERTLQVSVMADQAVAKPQDPGTFTIRVADHTGAPVQAQVSLAVIDEAVYGVKPDDTPDPVRFFYRREYTRVNTTFSSYYFTGFSGRDRLQLASRRRRPFTLADFKGDKPAQAQVRKDFPDAIYWLGDLVTNAAGEARMAVKYPDTLTTWRLTARAITVDTRAGTTVARTTTTKDLIVRVITPRFLTEGDDVVLPTLVHNYRTDPKTATVTMAATGLQPAGTPPAPATATLGAGAERRDDWRFAARAVGTARVTASATTDSDSDAVELPLPVLPYGVRREAAVSGSMAGPGEATASVTVPPASNPAARSISVAIAPSMAGSLLGALDFLTSYPYGCTEQTLSSFLPNLLVTRALTQLKLAPTERLSALDRMVSAGVQRLGEMQHQDGGWGWWPSDANHPFMTAYALWGLDEAKRAGVKVDDYRLASGLRALAQQYAEYPRAVPDLKAYVAYVLQHAGGDRADINWFAENARGQYRHAAARDELWSARDRMSAYGRALLLLTLDEAKDARAAELATALEGEAVTTGELSYWRSDTDPLLRDAVDTRVEATSLAVQALVRRNPRSPLLERAVRYLLVNRTGGYWGSTKQTAMAIYGLLAFMQARGETAQPFSVDVFVNGTLAGRRSFSAAALTAPDPEIVTVAARSGANDIRIVKRDGPGTAYWSAVGTYYDTAGAAARSGSRQLAIARQYAVLTPVTVQNRIVYRETPFTGTARPGDVLTVRLVVAGSKDWRYLAIEDPLPAGVESIQDTTAYPLENPRRDWWWGSQVEYRDQRTVFFQEGFENGRYEYLYLVRVTSEGTFRAAPAQVSPMYVPGVLASSEPLTLTVAPAAAAAP